MTPLQKLVHERAGGRCEYCKVHSALQCATFHLDHVQPVSRGGLDNPENLALSCPTCNLSKTNRLVLLDDESGLQVPIFNPRRDCWTDHFRFEGFVLVGLTSIGRALVSALNLNTNQHQFIRAVEKEMGFFPPP